MEEGNSALRRFNVGCLTGRIFAENHSKESLGKTTIVPRTPRIRLPRTEASPSRKDIELSPSGLPRCGSSLQKLKRLCFPFFRRCSHRALFPWPPLQAGYAVPYSTTRDHCGALRIFFAHLRMPARLIERFQESARYLVTLITRSVQ
jgi:hypothetical protein